ncbi:MAG: asparagine synthase (glutamine-hydrolyzing) [Omnitrophica bacterium]|nr:asparagine synthase (glutamine-hydrolyzing) [Candidatus Omnitrophota bacterium]
MCGIAGIIDFKNKNVEKKTVENMVSIQHHRGPDGRGFYFGEGIGLGHARLAIIDLSARAHQPMPNEDKTKWIIYNGEVYNYPELREELRRAGHTFRSVGDTEVILHAFEEWGEKALTRFNGMWAFAIWDTKKRELFASRDRFGQKPFYYHLGNDGFTFASEIKALLQKPSIEKSPNDQAIYDYIISGYGYMDISDHTFFKNIRQLKPAHYIRVSAKTKSITQKKYWDLNNFSPKHEKSESSYIEGFRELFTDAVRLRLRSDVELGISLSGGLDSSSVAYTASLLCKDDRISSFSSCFEEKDSDERRYINDTLKVTNLKPHFIFPDPAKIFSDIDSILWHQEEPYSTLSVFPQWHIMKHAKSNGVKVLLTGQAGDEALAGYHKYYFYFFADLFRTLKLGKAFREIKIYKEIKGKGAPVFKDVLKILLSHFLPEAVKRPGRKFFGNKMPGYVNRHFREECKTPGRPSRKFSSILDNDLYNALKISPLPSLLHIDDRSSMAHSVETRSPFLDYRLIEYAFTLPLEYKIRSGETKFILRKIMSGCIPESVRTRQDKMGFPTPLKSWLKGPMRREITDIFNSKEFNKRPYLDSKSVRDEFKFFCEKGKPSELTIWSWLNLELWLRKYID